MPDISNILVGTKSYDIKDNYARTRMIDNTTNSDVSAIVNFINGIQVGGNPLLAGATAEAIQVDANENASVDVSISPSGIASFSFKIPRAKIAYISAFYSGDTLIFGNDDDYHAEFVGSEVILAQA